MRFDAEFALFQILYSGFSVRIKMAINAGAVAKLIGLMQSCEFVLQMLSIIAANSASARDIVLQNRAVQAVGSLWQVDKSVR